MLESIVQLLNYQKKKRHCSFIIKHYKSKLSIVKIDHQIIKMLILNDLVFFKIEFVLKGKKVLHTSPNL